MKRTDLDRRVTFQRTVLVRDAANSPVETWCDIATVWAAKADISDGERVKSAEIGATVTTRFQVRWSSTMATLTAKDRALLGGLVYDISHIKELGRREGLEITATARADLS